MKRACEHCGKSFDFDPDDGRSRRRRFCSENCRKRAVERKHRATCTACGATLGVGSGWRKPRQCRPCDTADRRAEHDAKGRELERLWAAGMKAPELCKHFGWSADQLSVEMFRFREEGFDLPYRYNVSKRAGRVHANARKAA